MDKPLILVTNDDGITAPGIRALVDVASSLGEVIVVAPNSPQSGMGHAVTIHDPVRLHKSRAFENVEAYECSGTPVDCVKLAKHVLLRDRKPDLTLSGINHGSNAAINILYSGTLSAAMEASLEGVPSIGFSLLNFAYDADFDAAKPFLSELISFVLENGLDAGSLLNVNIPNLPQHQLKGMKVCRQADSRWEEEFMEATDPRGQKYYWLTGKFVNLDHGDDTDLWALENGFISVVPSMHDLTNYKAIPLLKDLESI
ncbi:MAG: 5'/3'-nucleotidase SurE [Saprospiraceae bacterium]